MKTKYFIAAMATVALASCKQELMPQDSSSAQEAAGPTASTQMPTQVPPTGQPQQASAQPNMQPTMQPVAQAPVKVAKGMNPPHGQPGHRCDIAVGAPLNSPAATAKAMPATTSQAGTAISREIAPPVKTAPGMNPPHGQPGHRCDIAVGAPLNSPPAATSATNATPALLSAPTENKQ